MALTTTQDIAIRVNGRDIATTVDVRKTLAEFIRENARLTGTHVGCDLGNCGACTVLMNDEAIRACLVLAVQADGATLVTIEGLEDAPDRLHPLQQAFIEHGALQCGFCTPGVLMNMCAYLRDNPDPGADDVRTALVGNLCRCGGYDSVVKAVLVAAARMRRTNA